MNRLLRNAACAALTVAAFGLTAGAASAQTYSRLVVFGDSLSDNGNVYAASGNTTPASPPYYQGRFSNGPVFTELLGFNVGRFTAGAPVTGSVNYAFGGARTEDIAGPPPGLRRQLTTYLAQGGTFGRNDLVSILGGAINIFQAFPTAAGNPLTAQTVMQATAAAAATDINFMVNRVATAGAGTVLVTNLPRLGTTPQFSASNPLVGPQGSALADFAGQQFNSALASRLAVTAAAQPNTNIILFDIYKVSDVLAANPSRFGLSNVTQPCFNGVTVCSAPDTYLFWDGVHPTAAGHRLFASLANDYLYYGDAGAESAIQGETAARQREDMLDMSSEVAGGRHWEPGARMLFDVIADSVETDARGVVGEAEAKGYGARVGVDYVADTNWRMGFAASWRQAEVDGALNDFDLDTYGVDAWLGWRSGATFLTASAGGAIDQYDITRVSSLAPIVMAGKTEGGSLGARLQGGLWFDMGGLAISPRAAVTWVSSDVNGYTEDGAAASYQYADRTVEGVTGEVSLRAEGGSEGLGFFVEGGYRDSISDRSDAVHVGIAGNTAQVLAREVEDPFGGSILASAGVETNMGPFSVSLAYKGRFGDAADSHMGGVTFKLPLQ